VFEDQLGSARDEEFLLQAEEEDILNAFMTWTREKRALHGVSEQTFEDSSECIEQLERLEGMPFSKRIV
jgi:hypothetical protein